MQDICISMRKYEKQQIENSPRALESQQNFYWEEQSSGEGAGEQRGGGVQRQPALLFGRLK